MSPEQIARLSDEAIVRMVANPPEGGEVGTLVSEEVFSAIVELRRRHRHDIDLPRTATGRVRSANSVELDPDRWRAAWYRRRLTQTALSELTGKSYTWTHSVMRRGTVSYFALDAIAAELGEDTDMLLYEIASDRERQRIPLG